MNKFLLVFGLFLALSFREGMAAEEMSVDDILALNPDLEATLVDKIRQHASKERISPLQKNMQLRDAAKDGDLDTVERLVNDPEIYINWGDGEALREAACRGHDVVIRTLLNHRSINPNLKYGEGEDFPLTIAITQGRLAAIDALLNDHRTDVNQTKNGRPPLYIAIEEYITSRDRPDSQKRGLEDLFKRVLHNGLSIVTRLTEHQSIDVNKPYRHSLFHVYYPLKTAAEGYWPEAVAVLLKHPKIDVSVVDKEQYCANADKDLKKAREDYKSDLAAPDKADLVSRITKTKELLCTEDDDFKAEE